MHYVHTLSNRSRLIIVTLIAMVLSVSSTWNIASRNLTVAFTDSVARLTLGRSITDAINPGLAQNGGIWPPFPQFMMQPFIQNDWLYQTGLAGVIPQMIGYIIASICIYKLATLLGFDFISSLGAFLLFSTPNILVMQAVPMAESMFITFFVMSVYFLTRWTLNREEFSWLRYCGISAAGACMTRYEGIFLLGVMGLVVLVYKWRDLTGTKFQLRQQETIGNGILLGSAGAFVLVVWLVFEFVYFKDFLYFIRSPYSPWAVAQESLSYVSSDYKTAGKLSLSLLVYSRTVLDNVGIFPMVLSLIGCAVWLFSKYSPAVKTAMLVFTFPFFFFVFALFQGSSVVIWHPDLMMGANWATRYGTLMIPFVALFGAYCISRFKFASIRALALVGIIATSVMIWQQGPISLGEAIANQGDEETQAQRSAGDWLNEHYDGGLVLMQRADAAWIPFDSGIKLRDIVSENTPTEWNNALINPIQAKADWIVMRKAIRTGSEDQVWSTFEDSTYLKNYLLVYDYQGVRVYRMT